MSWALIHLLFAASLWAQGDLVREVRSAISRGDFALGESLVEKGRAGGGETPETLEAYSWLGRGALAAKQYDKAEAYALETQKRALEQLKSRSLDAEKRLPIALGAAIEVRAQVMAARGGRSEAVDFLNQELAKWRHTSIRTRIQKNIHLLSLEGKPAPELETAEWLGPKPEGLAGWKGRPVLLFFWAHWCGDCKEEAPVLARLAAEYAGRGLVIAGPTQRYGYGARGVDLAPAEELKYIDEVRRKFYGALASMPVPVSEENFKRYGSSTTPTLVLIDRAGIVRLYHPGNLDYAALSAKVKEVLGG